MLSIGTRSSWDLIEYKDNIAVREDTQGSRTVARKVLFRRGAQDKNKEGSSAIQRVLGVGEIDLGDSCLVRNVYQYLATRRT